MPSASELVSDQKNRKGHPSLATLMMAKVKLKENNENDENANVDELTEVGQLLDSALLMECLVGGQPRVLLSPSLTKCLVTLST